MYMYIILNTLAKIRNASYAMLSFIDKAQFLLIAIAKQSCRLHPNNRISLGYNVVGVLKKLNL